MRKSSLALLLAIGAGAILGSTQPAWSQTDPQPVLESADQSFGAISKARAGRLRSNAASDPDTVWIGHVRGSTGLPGTAGGFGPYHVGRGLNLAVKTGATNAEASGYWDFDSFNSGETDSLQGWWPLNRGIGTTGGVTLNDKQRGFHGFDFGNQASYVMNAVGGQKRTFGVIGIWHRDPGSNVPGLADTGAVVPGPDVEWAPINGGASAWCGLRGHNDLTVQDPITGNYFNQNTIDRMGTMTPAVLGGSLSATGTDGNMPGYASQWDQMLYRDVVVAANSGLNITYNYRTNLSTIVHTAAATRIGWFDKDPIKLPAANDGNFISSTDADVNAPADSFMVYIGNPVEPVGGPDNDFRCSDPSAGNNGDGFLEIFDVQRRWFSEVIAINKPYRELVSKTGVNAVTPASHTFTIAEINAILHPGEPLNTSGGTVRLVFRVKTNRGGDDMDRAQSGFSSLTAGAAIIDDVVSNTTGWSLAEGNFENATGTGAIDNATGVSAVANWKSTGKPAGLFFHAHDINDGLVYNDACGLPGSPSRQNNMYGKVISAGDHDLSEKLGGPFGSQTQDRHSWFGSPTINLKSTGDGDYNGQGIDAEIADASEYRLQTDIYTGGVKGNGNGNFFQFGWSSFPALQANGLKVWGEIRTPPVISFFGLTAGLQTISRNALTDANIITSNANGIPDSVRIYIQHLNRCFAVPALTGLTCSPATGLNAGLYFDNIAFALIDAERPPTISFNIWDLYSDAFPVNGTSALLTAPLGAGIAFDTCAAQVRIGNNVSQGTGAAINRFNIPGDSLVFTAGNTHNPPSPGGNQLTRVDLVFRILPGVGNYVTLGTKGSGVAQRPDVAVRVAASPGDGSFWGEYMSDNGAFGTGGNGVTGPGHPGGWDQNRWNSARCDTAERNLFLSQGHSNNLHAQAAGVWGGIYHESDPKFNTLGINKNRCFLQNNAAGNLTNANNVNCGNGTVPNPAAPYPPPWTALPTSGFNGSTVTKEFTKILPDGQLTPGAHVQYFVRKSVVGAPLANFEVQPDTNKIASQPSEGSTDGHRWQEFGVLPDRWKAPAFGGQGMACLLYVDGNDRRGDERFFISVMDSIGGTSAGKRGAHNGWSARGDFDWTPNGGNPNVGNLPDGPTNPATLGRAHGGQPGTIFDMFGLKASESGTTCGSLANRSAGTGQPIGLALGKTGQYGPTGDMLRTFYRTIFYNSGDLGQTGTPLIGPYADKSDDDVALLSDFATITSGTPKPRGVWVMGRSFAESQSNPTNGHDSWFVNYFGANIGSPGGAGDYYSAVSPIVAPDLIPQAPVGGGPVLGVASTCLIDDDVLQLNTSVGAVAAAYYQNAGTSTDPQEAAAYVPVGTSHDHISLLSGYRIQSIGSRYTLSRGGLLTHMLNAYTNVFGTLCALVPGAPLGVGDGVDGGTPFVSFMNLRSSNPMRSGEAQIGFGVSKTEKVEVNVFDVTGRKVKTVANRVFQGGVEHVVTWDGTNDLGQSVARGVYFYQLRSPSFTSQKKLTVLKN